MSQCLTICIRFSDSVFVLKACCLSFLNKEYGENNLELSSSGGNSGAPAGFHTSFVYFLSESSSSVCVSLVDILISQTVSPCALKVPLFSDGEYHELSG